MDAPAPFKARYPDGSVREVDTFVIRRCRSEVWRRGKLVHAAGEAIEVDYAGSFPQFIVMVADRPDEDGVFVSLVGGVAGS